MKKVSNNSLQIQHPKKAEFLDLYRQTKGFISDICRAVQIDRSTYYKWLDTDEQFALAIADAESEINDEMKQILIDKAGSGDLGAVIFWLKNKHPEFNQRQLTNVAVQVNTFIKNEKEEFGI